MTSPALTSPPARWALTMALALLAVGATLAMGRSPVTFPMTGLLFWASTGMVVAAWAVVGVAALASFHGNAALLAATIVAPGGLFFALGVTGGAVFTATSPRLWAGIALLGGFWVAGFYRSLNTFLGASRWVVLAGFLAGTPWGVVWVLSRVPPPAGTRPALGSLPAHAARQAVEGVDVEGDAVRLRCGTASVELRPLLVFKDSSLDGFWPGGSARSPLEGVPRLEGPQARAALTVTRDGAAVTVEALTLLPKPVHSHLNTFTDVRLEGLTRPALRFAATGSTAFAFTPFDYPHGRPARFAFRSATGQLVVQQCADAEKGPFTSLAGGPLGPEEPLRLTVLDGDAAVCELTFLDFAAQADVTESPTAGEGVATNVVQFGLPARPPGPPVIHLSLAETGIGAGREAVTHAAGVYRNRVVIAPASP